MELILNYFHRFWGFVYQYAYFSADKRSIKVAVRPRKGSAAVCSRCHLPALGYDQLAERRFEFIPLWGSHLHSYTMPCVDGRHCGVVTVEEVLWGDGKRTHIVAKMNKALNEVRTGESHHMASEGRTPLLKKARWLLLKREENLEIEQRFRCAISSATT